MEDRFPVKDQFPDKARVPDKDRWIVLYDGYCNLCSCAVRWIVRNDRGKLFLCIPLQDARARSMDPGQGYLKGFQLDDRDLSGDSVLLIREGKIYDRSSAVLRIASHLRFPWPILALFFLVPRVLRDLFYDLVARNRKKWFGERTTCFLP